MKGTGKRILSLLLIFTMLGSLSACGGNDSAANAAVKEHVFRAESIPINTDRTISNTRTVCRIGDRLYLLCMNWEESGQENFLLTMNLDGTDTQVTDLEIQSKQSENNAPMITETVARMPVVNGTEDETSSEEAEESSEDPENESETGEAPETSPAETEDVPEETSSAGSEDAPADFDEKYPEGGEVSYGYNISQMVSDGTGLYLLINEYYNDYRDPNNSVYEEKFFLIGLDLQGKEQWRQELGRNDNNTPSYTYVNSIIATDSGILCGFQNDSGSMYAIYDNSGAKKEEFKLEVEESGSFYLNGKGELLFQYWGEQEGNWQQMVRKLDLTTKTLSEPLTIPGMNNYSLNICQNVYGGAYDLYLYDATAVYGCKEGDSDKTEILNFIDSDLDNSNMNNLIILDDQNMLLLEYDYTANNNEGEYRVSRLTKVDPADVKDKTVLKLACYGNLWQIRSKVLAFNKSNENYRIQITDYESAYNETGDWTAGITKLNNDIISGNVPDILYLNSAMPVSSYVSKGLFADLYPFIDKDPDMKREDFFANILEAYSVDGKLYQLVPSFTVQTVVAKTKYVGDTPGWTMEDMQNLLSTLPENMVIFDEMTRENYLYMAMNRTGSQFVDWKTGKCSFDSDEFIRLLEFCNTFPEEFDYSVYEDDSYWQKYESMYREDRTLLAMLYLNSFTQYRDMLYGPFGEPITMIGFPSAPGNGACISSDLSIAMSAKSKHQDGIWEFMRQYLLDDYQSKEVNGWPLRLSCIEDLKTRAMQRPYWEDPTTGKREEYDDKYWLNDQEIILPVMTEEEIETVMGILTTVSEVAVSDDNLLNIVTEEAAAYFSGQKQAKEVADIIQSRAGIYISENR